MGFNQLFLPLFMQMVILIELLPSSTPILASPSFSVAKPGCDDHCGDLSIPFPFGTEEGCYLNEDFFINCANSSQPLLRTGNLSVIDISLEGQLRLLQFVAHDCYNEHGSRSTHNEPWMKLAEGLTFNSTANKFTTVGCDSNSLVRGYTEEGSYYVTGCVSYCELKEDVKNGSCAGIGCCQTSIPPGAWQINVSLTSYFKHANVLDFNPCSHAFVVDDRAFQFFAENLTNLKNVERLPVVVDWIIDNMTCEAAQMNTSYPCSTINSGCQEIKGLGYRCFCQEGYEGNPYLPGGCQDIDECKDISLHKCRKNSTCSNTVGNYTCPCLKGYHGDGREGAEGCTPDQNHDETIHWPMIVSGFGIGIAILLLCCFCLYSELKRRKENRLKMEFFRKNGGLILQQQLTKQRGDMNAARIFTLEELKKATNDFDESQIIGKGGFGTVFKGVLADTSTVAIKKSTGICESQVEQFINEVIVLSRVNNRYVVKLLGCCLETEVPLLAYEFISNGTLLDHLHNQIKAAKLSWNIRIRIASEVAGVLAYMHSTSSPPIVHRDIKSSNILLDQNYTAKVSDFGISKLVPSNEDQVSTAVQGTPGYLDPEYLQTGLLTEKSDVYSYGVVLAELLTGKKVVSWDRPEAQRFLAHHFISSLKEGLLVQVLDPNIVCNESTELLNNVAMIAKCCLSVKGEDRPSMKDIARELEVLEIKAKKSVVQVFEIDSTETEALIDLESTNAYVNVDDSSCLFTGSHTVAQNMMLSTDCGR